MSTQATKRKCKFCLTEFEPNHGNRDYCCLRCRRRYHRHLELLRKGNNTPPKPRRLDNICPRCHLSPRDKSSNGHQYAYCHECKMAYAREWQKMHPATNTRQRDLSRAFKRLGIGAKNV